MKYNDFCNRLSYLNGWKEVKTTLKKTSVPKRKITSVPKGEKNQNKVKTTYEKDFCT